MKNFLIFLVTSILLVFLTGCNNFSKDIWTPDDDIEDTRFIYSYNMYGKLMRYDIVDKKAVVACPDPMCDHTTKSCMVSNLFTAYQGKDCFILGRFENGALGGNTLYYYNIKSGEIIKILDCPRYQEVGFIDDFALFSASHAIYNDDGSPNGEVWDVYKYVMSTNTLTKINKESLNYPIAVESYTSDAILWFDYDAHAEMTYFTTDYNFENKQNSECILPIGDYVYNIDTVYANDHSYTFEITRENSESGEKQEVIADIWSYRLDNINDPHGIVYTLENDNSAIYYVSFSDLSRKKLCDIPKGYKMGHNLAFPDSGVSLYAGGYVGIHIAKENADHSESEKSNIMLFVNVDNLDSFIIES